MLFALVVVLVHALTVQASIFSHKSHDIEALCNGNSVDLTSLEQLRQLNEALDESSCSSNNKRAIYELAKLVDATRGDLCSTDSINKFKSYYDWFLETSSDDSQKAKLPKKLKKLALAYGMQMSSLCKRNMVRVLTERGHSLLAEDDLSQIERVIGDESPIAKILEVMGEPGEILVPGDLAPLLKRQGVDSAAETKPREKLFIQTTTGSYIKSLQTACRQRIEPVYGPLMMPLVQLAHMGFNYRDEPLRCDLKCPAVVREVGRWSRIVFVCESLKSLNIVESPEDQETGEGSGGKLVRIVTEQEAAAIEGAASIDVDITNEPLVSVHYEKVALDGDQIYNKDDKLLVKALKSFKTYRNEEANIERRMLSRSLTLFKQELKRGHVGFLIGASFKTLVRRIKSEEIEILKPNEGLVKILDDVVSNDVNPDRSVSAKADAKAATIFTPWNIVALASICLCTLSIILTVTHG